MLTGIAILLVWTISTATTVITAPAEIQPSVYLATKGRGVSAFSLVTHQTKKIVNSTEDLVGIAYNSINNKLYFSTLNTIYEANTDGGEVETVLNTDVRNGSILGLAFDWIGGNVYVATEFGYILACGVGASQTFSCYTILGGQAYAYGISLDPTEGLMYWTIGASAGSGSIQRAGMDGSDNLTLVSGLDFPVGVTIDFASRRLYWTEYYGNRIQSSDLDGRDIQLTAQLPSNSYPWGIAVLSDRIYWSSLPDNKLQSAAKDELDVQTLYTETGFIYHLTVVPTSDPTATRANDCERRNCSKLCVLSPASYRCLG